MPKVVEHRVLASMVEWQGEHMPAIPGGTIRTDLSPEQQQALDLIFKGMDIRKVGIRFGMPVADLRLLAQSEPGMHYLAGLAINGEMKCHIRDDQMDFALNMAIHRLAAILANPQTSDKDAISAAKEILDRHQSRRYTRTQRTEQTITGRVQHNVRDFRAQAVKNLAEMKGISETEVLAAHQVHELPGAALLPDPGATEELF